MEGVAVAGREQRPWHENRQVELGAGRQVTGVYVARPLGRRQHRVLTGLVGRDAHRAAERCDRNLDVVPQLRALAVPEVEVANVRVAEVRSQETKAGQERRPSPGPGLELTDLALERVSGLRTLPVDGAAQRVQAVGLQDTRALITGA